VRRRATHTLHDLLIEARALQERLPRASLRLVGAAAALALIAVLVLRSSSVTGNLRQLSHPRPLLLGVAVSLEVLSILAYALMLRQLLGRGGLPTRTLPLLRMTLAGIAMSASLPGGTAASTLYWFRELRHEGAERSRAALVMAEGMALGIISLLALLVLGVAIAGASGPLAAARIPILVASGAAFIGVVLFQPWVKRALHPLFARLPFPQPIAGHAPSRGESVVTLALLALTNWALDCAVLALALAAVQVHTPMRGLLLAYCLAQIVAAIPLLPGGAGTVEASLILGLAAFGHTTGPLVAGVLLYRLLSNWGLIPIGWGAVAAVALRRSSFWEKHRAHSAVAL
jgi:putative heme transporter